MQIDNLRLDNNRLSNRLNILQGHLVHIRHVNRFHILISNLYRPLILHRQDSLEHMQDKVGLHLHMQDKVGLHLHIKRQVGLHLYTKHDSLEHIKELVEHRSHILDRVLHL